MILDSLKNTHQYFAIHKRFEKAFSFLSRPDIKELPVDTYEIDGKSVYAMVSKDYGRKKNRLGLKPMKDILISNWSLMERIIWDGNQKYPA